MVSTSVIEISKSALQNNIDFIKKEIGENCELSSVIKGNAYGHGIEVFVPLAQECGIKHFSVFSSKEAYITAKVAIEPCKIMIMGMIDSGDLEWIIKNDIEYVVFDQERLLISLEICKKLKKKVKIHIELETGLNRTGFSQASLNQIIPILKQNSVYFSIEGICTHYAGAESIANYLRIQKQIKNFNKIQNWLIKQDIHPEIVHTACSAAAMSYPKTRMDMARIGIMQYGFWPSRETLINYLGNKKEKTDPLKSVIKWKSTVMNTKTVKAGEFIGYGTTYMAESETKIAIVPVGYAEGYSRSLSNQGRVLINGHRVSVIGIVNMNMLITDITYVPETKIGDEVVLIGEQGDLAISVSSFGELSDQLNYELLTRLPRDIPRIVTD